MAKKRNKTEKILNGIVGLCMLIALEIGFKTESIKNGISVFFVCIIIIIVAMLVYKSMKNKRLYNSGIDTIDKMTGIQFEKFLSLHFEKLGYKVKLTPATGDYGADLILEGKSETIVVQAKRWKKSVGIEAVQQVAGDIKYYSATKAMVITNSIFTPNAEKLARTNEIELWDREKLIDVMLKSNGKKDMDNIIASKEGNCEKVNKDYLNNGNKDNEEKKCPRCGGSLTLRKGKYGEFLGCSGYPKCRYTKNVN